MEPSKGQSVSTPEKDNVEPKQTEEEPKGATEPQKPESELPERFKGKTTAEIAKSYQELESQFGKQGEEFGKVKEDLGAYQTYYQQQQAAQQQPQRAQQPTGEVEPTNYDDLFLEKPKEAFDKRFDDRMKTERDRIRYEVSIEAAYRDAPNARERARIKYPEAFAGITDQELDQIMYGGVQARAISPLMLGDDNSWAGAAGQLQMRKRGFKFGSTSPNPMNPTVAETPIPGTPTEEDEKAVRLQADSVFMAQQFTNPKTGKPYTEKEAAEKVGKAREERERTGG